MQGYYGKLFKKALQGINYRLNGLLVKKILGSKKNNSVINTELAGCCKKCTLLPGQFLILDEHHKIMQEHIIPATYKNAFIHLGFLNVLRAIFLPPSTKRIFNSAFVWGNKWSTGYYHFVAEDLPKLVYMKNTGIPLYTWRTKSPGWRNELLTLFAIESNVIKEPILIDELCYIANNRIKTGQYRFSILHPALSKALMAALHNIVGAWGPATTTTITWISRKYTFDRTIINEDECIQRLRETGLSVNLIYPEKLTVKQQIMAVYNTAWLIGPHGAGLTNILFTSKANIIEIGPEKSINNAFTSLAASLNRQHEYIQVKSENKLAKNRSNFYISSIDDFICRVLQAINTQAEIA